MPFCPNILFSQVKRFYFSTCFRNSGEKRRLQTTKSDTAIAQTKISHTDLEQGFQKQALIKANSEGAAQSLKVKSTS